MKHQKSSVVGQAQPCEGAHLNLRLALLPALFVVVALAAACEDKAIGRPCDLTVDAGPTQGAYAIRALDCPSQLCAKPAVQTGVSIDQDTGPYCTIICNSDSDCDGQSRESGNPEDRRCKTGYTCAVTFGPGELVTEGGGPQSLCCQKICLCRDFFLKTKGPTVPDVCQADPKSSCS